MNTKAVIRWGILGPGNIARRFAGQLPHSSTGTLYAVASRSLEKAKPFAEEFGAEATYGSYEELLADDRVDAVYISTVHTNHHELVVRAAAAGKHVLCEKPLAVNHAWAMAAVEAASAQGTFLAEAYMYRFHPQTAKVREVIAAGTIGDVHAIEASFAFDATPKPGGRLFSTDLAGGAILDVGGYPVSMARMIAGAAVGAPFLDPERVSAVGQLGDGIDEWSVATLFFPSGVTARVSTGVRAGDDNSVTVYGSRGRLVLSNPWVIDPAGPGRIHCTVAGEGTQVLEIDPAYAYALEADAVGVRGDSLEAPEITWADSLGNARVLDQWRSAIGLVYPVEGPTASIPPVTTTALAGRDRVPDSPAMRYAALPGFDRQLSTLVMGCDNQQTLAHASVMFDDFVERGGTTFDTAYHYGSGRAERLVGRWLANRGNRDDVVLIGKGAHTPNCNPESVTQQLEWSLDNLGTDHVDVYFLHRDNLGVGVGEFIDVLDEHQRAGRIRAFGGSNWTIDRFVEANRYARQHGKHQMVALSNHFGLARAHDVPWTGCEHVTDPASRAWLTTHDVPLLPWSSQARGFFAPGRAHPDQLGDPELVRCYYSDENFERLRRATELADELGVLSTAIALAYVLHQPFPTFALIGPRSLAETRTSIQALTITLTQPQLDWLDLTSDTRTAPE